MRYFDTLGSTEQQNLIDYYAQVAKYFYDESPVVELCEGGYTTWTELDFALYYTESLELNSSDFSSITNWSTISPWNWVGSVPRRPRP